MRFQSVTEYCHKAKYYSEGKLASLKDSQLTFTGRKANYYARKIPDSPKMPANFLHELKTENPKFYSKFLSEISQVDYDTLKAICDYPNRLTLLLNTGRDGVRLIDETDGQIIILSKFAYDMQRFILSYPDISRRRDLLMFMLYNDISGYRWQLLRRL